jgi:hypothetical protein
MSSGITPVAARANPRTHALVLKNSDFLYLSRSGPVPHNFNLLVSVNHSPYEYTKLKHHT